MSTKSVKTVLVVGKTGSGKSSLCNLLNGIEEFAVSDSTESCTDMHQILTTQDGLMLIDTQGLGDTNEDDDKTCEKITEALKTCAFKGIDVILFVVPFGRLDKQECETICYMVQRIFGAECKRNVIIVYTKAKADLVLYKEDRNNWIKKQLSIATTLALPNNGRPLSDKELKAIKFRNIYEICESRVCFVDNPPVSKSKTTEKSNEEHREASRNSLLTMINARPWPKFLPAFALEAQRKYKDELHAIEQRKRQHEEQIRSQRDEAVREQMRQQFDAQRRRDKEAAQVCYANEIEDKAKHVAIQAVNDRPGFFATLGAALAAGTFAALTAITGGATLAVAGLAGLVTASGLVTATLAQNDS